MANRMKKPEHSKGEQDEDGRLHTCYSRNVIPVSVGLGWFVSKYWCLFTTFVGLNLLQSAFTR